MYKLQRKLFSQNFLHSRRLVYQLIGSSSLAKNDLVLEIGCGKGILTESLIQRAGHVIGVEIDARWYQHLQEKFTHATNLTLYNQDILSFPLPGYPYKVFANIPFSIEGKIIRKLIDDAHPPQDSYVVVMKELADRLSGLHGENLFSLMHKPWFEFSIPYYFRRTDFVPIPNVDAVLFRFTIKKDPLIPVAEKERYQRFITRGFGNGQSIGINVRKWYGKEKTASALHTLSLSRKTKPSYVKLKQWIVLYTLLRGF